MNDETKSYGEDAFTAFNEAFREYIKYNKRDLALIIQSRAYRFKAELQKRFADIAPTPGKLDQELRTRGFWRTKVPGYKSSMKGKLATDKNKHGITQKEIEADRRRDAINREMRLRKRSIKYLSAIWLYKEWRINDAIRKGKLKARKREDLSRGKYQNRFGGQAGEVDFHLDDTDNPWVALRSFALGSRIQDEKHGIVEDVIQHETADILEYVRKKQQAELDKIAEKVNKKRKR